MKYIRTSRAVLAVLTGIVLGMWMALAYGCGYKVNVMGVEVATLERGEVLPAIAGGVASYALHEAAHWAMLEYKGYDHDWQLEGMELQYSYKQDVDQSVQQAGFLSQILVGAVLNVIPYTKDSAFTLGFNGMAAAGAVTYRARYGDGGDHQGDDGLWLRDTALTTANALWTVYNRRAYDPTR